MEFVTKEMQILAERLEEKGKEEGREEGRKEGLLLGMDKGREEGILLGIDRGMKESSVKIAKRLITLGLAMKDIATATGLSLKEVEGLY